MKYEVVLPIGADEKTLFVNDSTIKITRGQIVENDFLQSRYPQFFKAIKGTTVETLDEVVPKEVEPEMELLLEEPERQVEVEIIADEPEEEVAEETVDYESLTVKELKVVAEEKGIELTSTKKKDIIAELNA